MQHLNERNVFTKTITIIQIMNEMCTWTNLVHRTNIGISPLKIFYKIKKSAFETALKFWWGPPKWWGPEALASFAS